MVVHAIMEGAMFNLHGRGNESAWTSDNTCEMSVELIRYIYARGLARDVKEQYDARGLARDIPYMRIFSSDKNFEGLNYVLSGDYFSWTYDRVLIKIRTTKNFKG